jgi:hypothetical protein
VFRQRSTDRHRQQALRREPDVDPLVEAATERLRQSLGSLAATDTYGRQLAWREVVRIALADLDSPRVRDAVTAELLSEALLPGLPRRRPKKEAVSPDETWSDHEWKSLFQEGTGHRDDRPERASGDGWT